MREPQDGLRAPSRRPARPDGERGPEAQQRGGQPDAQDRIFATQCGVEAALGCLRGEFGYMIALRDGKMCHMPLEDVAGKLKFVDPQSDLVREAKALGISFGDE